MATTTESRFTAAFLNTVRGLSPSSFDRFIRKIHGSPTFQSMKMDVDFPLSNDVVANAVIQSETKIMLMVSTDYNEEKMLTFFRQARLLKDFDLILVIGPGYVDDVDIFDKSTISTFSMVGLAIDDMLGNRSEKLSLCEAALLRELKSLMQDENLFELESGDDDEVSIEKLMRPSWFLMATFSRQIAGFEGPGKFIPHEDDDVCIMRWSNGERNLVVAWTFGDETPLDIARVTDGKPAKSIVSAYGNPVERKGQESLLLSEIPLYIAF